MDRTCIIKVREQQYKASVKEEASNEPKWN